MKLKKIILLTAMAGFFGATLSGCGRSKIEVGGSKTIQVKAYRAGYDIKWLDQLIVDFEAAFPDIKVELVEATSITSSSATMEILSPNTNQIDLYFVAGGEVPNIIDQSKNILRNPNMFLLEDLTDVYESCGVISETQVETKTIKERFIDGFKDYCTYNGHVQNAKGKMFKLPWANGVVGICANAKVLNDYDIDIPLTSNEFTAAIQKLATEGIPNGVYPYTYAGGNAPGYWNYLYETWLAQSLTFEGYSNFLKLEPTTGTFATNGYSVYDNEKIKDAIQAMWDILDINYSEDGTTDLNHIDAQTKLNKGKAAFMVDGDWVLNEALVSEEEYNNTKECVMMKTPVLSSIGVDEGITDAQLHDLVSYIDQGKTEEEILVLMPSIQAKTYQRVYEARSIYNSEGVGHEILIPSYADAKEAAKLFVRYMYSNKGCRTFHNYANADLPLRFDLEAGDKKSTFQDSVDAIAQFKDAKVVSGNGELNDRRALMKLYLFSYSSWAYPQTWKTIILDKYSKTPKLSVSKIYEGERDYVRISWSTLTTGIE